MMNLRSKTSLATFLRGPDDGAVGRPMRVGVFRVSVTDLNGKPFADVKVNASLGLKYLGNAITDSNGVASIPYSIGADENGTVHFNAELPEGIVGISTKLDDGATRVTSFRSTHPAPFKLATTAEGIVFGAGLLTILAGLFMVVRSEKSLAGDIVTGLGVSLAASAIGSSIRRNW